MRALVIAAPGSIAIEEVGDPVPAPGEVLIASRAVGLCRTDIEILRGELEPGWVEYPCVPGHEWSGTVAGLGPGVEDLEPGQRVVCEGMQPCLRCRRCLAGDTNLCERYRQLGFTHPGGAAELVSVPRTFVHGLAPGVSLEGAVLIEPAASVVRMLRRLALRAGESVGVVGIGTLGALGVLLARRAGAGPIVAFGIRRAELDLARALGADEAVDVSGAEPEAALDVVLETAGSAAAVRHSIEAARAGGRVGLLGLAGHGEQLTLPADLLANRDLSLTGGASYDRAAWAETVAIVNEGGLDLDAALGAVHPIDDFSLAYEALEQGRTSGKSVLTHVT